MGINSKKAATQYKLIALDLDGTLTNSRKQITPKTLKALFRAQEAGVRVVLASGRPTPGIEPLVKQLQLEKYDGYILPYNGGEIISCATHQRIFQQILPHSEIPALYQTARQFGLSIISYDNDAILTETPNDKYVQIEAGINQMPVKGVSDFVATITWPVTKCLIVGEPSRVKLCEAEAKKTMGEKVNFFQSAPYFLECVAPGIDKAKSIERLIGRLGITQEQVVACGDGYNDLSMIEYAGLGVAMGNAQPGVLSRADMVTLTNDANGVAYVVKNHVFKTSKARRMIQPAYWRLRWQNHRMKSK